MMRLKKKPTTFMRQQNEDEVGPSYNPVKEIKSWQGLNGKTSEGQRVPFYPRY